MHPPSLTPKLFKDFPSQERENQYKIGGFKRNLRGAGLRLIQVGIGGFGWSWANIVKDSRYWEPVAYVDLDEEK